MKILFIGDISAEPGRKTVEKVLPKVKDKYKPDVVIANCENAAGGLGVNTSVLNELQGYGVDFFTSGDHVWTIKGFLDSLLDTNLPLVRPYNYEGTEQLPGKGYEILDLGSKGRLLIVNLLGQSFMNGHARNPFWSIDELLSRLHEMPDMPENILIDFHAETTSEKLCLAYYLKNRVSAVLGTHTHVPTCDQRIIDQCAYVTDVGQVGPLDASLWIKFDTAIHNFKYPFRKPIEVETEGKMVFNSVLIELKDGKAQKIIRIDEIL